MKYNPQKHHRRSIRLPEYDYTQPGAYFLTLCTWKRECLFGEIIGEIMRLNPVGQIVKAEWKRLVYQFSNISLDAFVVMPNHLHGIIVINSAVGATRHLPIGNIAGNEPLPNDTHSGPEGSPRQDDICIDRDRLLRSEDSQLGRNFPLPKGPARGSLGAMIGQFKSRATKRI